MQLSIACKGADGRHMSPRDVPASLRVPQLSLTVASPDGGMCYRNWPDPFKAVKVIKGKSDTGTPAPKLHGSPLLDPGSKNTARKDIGRSLSIDCVLDNVIVISANWFCKCVCVYVYVMRKCRGTHCTILASFF